MIIKISPDKERARSMIKMAGQRKGSLKKLKDSGFPTIVAETYYEIIKELLTACLYVEGKKATGEYAHKDLIIEASKIFHLTNEESSIIDDLRVKRNNSQYYGREIPSLYFETYEQKLKDIIKKLENLLNKQLQ